MTSLLAHDDKGSGQPILFLHGLTFTALSGPRSSTSSPDRSDVSPWIFRATAAAMGAGRRLGLHRTRRAIRLRAARGGWLTRLGQRHACSS